MWGFWGKGGLYVNVRGPALFGLGFLLRGLEVRGLGKGGLCISVRCLRAWSFPGGMGGFDGWDFVGRGGSFNPPAQPPPHPARATPSPGRAAREPPPPARPPVAPSPQADSVPRALRWLPRISLIKAAFQALVINEVEGLEFDADDKARGGVEGNWVLGGRSGPADPPGGWG